NYQERRRESQAEAWARGCTALKGSVLPGPPFQGGFPVTVVMVVDDVSAMAEQYAYDLKRIGGYETLIAGSGREALDLLQREAVDAGRVDLEMASTDGVAVASGSA